MSAALAFLSSGLLAGEAVRVALAIGALAAVVSGTVGVFTVIRGQSFAGEALADIGTAGGPAALLAGISPLWGFAAVDVLAAGAMELIGVQRARGRDVATGIVLGVGLGLAALLLYLDTTHQSTTGATVTILFGSVFAIPASTIPLALLISVAALGVIAVVFRPLLLSCASPEIAAARGIPVRAIGACYLLALALAVALAALTIGTILSTALLVGPAATALRLTRRPGAAIAAAGAIGVTAMWLGIVLAYESYYWPPAGTGWPVSFFVVTIVFVAYLASGLAARVRARER